MCILSSLINVRKTLGVSFTDNFFKIHLLLHTVKHFTAVNLVVFELVAVKLICFIYCHMFLFSGIKLKSSKNYSYFSIRFVDVQPEGFILIYKMSNFSIIIYIPAHIEFLFDQFGLSILPKNCSALSSAFLCIGLQSLQEVIT